MNPAKPPLALIHDTDIGDDIDDALAITLLLHSPEVELRGITTVFRDGVRRAQLTRQLLRAWNRSEIPVAAGVSRPLLQKWESLHNGAKLGKQFEVLAASEPNEDSPLPSALDFIPAQLDLDLAPGPQLTLLCTGPLTNAALLLAGHPELAARLRIVLMGGMFSGDMHGQPWEWNIFCDPEAAAIVFNSGADISVLPIDVTRRCVLHAAQTTEIEDATSPGGALLGRMLWLWCQETRALPTLHDPLAALCAFMDDLVLWMPMHVEVGLCGPQRGVTRVASRAPNARVAVDVDVPRVLAEFMRRVVIA